MASLAKDLRRELERTVIKARRVAEVGARKALESLAVGNEKPWPSMTDAQKNVRVRLRAHGRQLGVREGTKRDSQTIEHLVQECAYEQWHRMLFARFLAENNLLIEPESKVAISLEECRELAMERGTDWLALASDFAVRMLPQIFRKGDPVLEVALTPETRHELEGLLKELPADVFAADDSLGWVYQFWQSERKDEVNQSGEKIGADELAAVTQLFTEDYMVLFLLHNTLGAWWAAKRKAEGRNSQLSGYEWTYLRLKEDGTPAAGPFDGWPRAARDLKVLDPCMGSGHFLVFALPVLVGFRMEEEGLSRERAVEAVLRDNLFGLELDNRCTQIAAFNLALMAWRMVGGFRDLPQLNLACSGLGINAREEEWLKLAGKEDRLKEAMKALYGLFEKAPLIGSLIDPTRIGGNLFTAQFDQVRSLLEKALAAEGNDETTHELVVAARGIVHAARMLADKFTLVATNVPYLGRPKQNQALKDYCDRYHSAAKADLGTCLLERCIAFCKASTSVAIVCRQNWLFQDGYKELRKKLLKQSQWNFVAKLGTKAFETITGEVVNVALAGLTSAAADTKHSFSGLDVSLENSPREKSAALIGHPLTLVPQLSQLNNPDAIITFEAIGRENLLSDLAFTAQGFATSDNPPFMRSFWELSRVDNGWVFAQSAPEITGHYEGRSDVLLWQDGQGAYYRHAMALKEAGRLGGWRSGFEAWGKKGVLIAEMSNMPATLYTGDMYDHTAHAVIPRDEELLPALWAFCSTGEFRSAVRKVSQKLNVTNETLVKVQFDVDHWKQVAQERYATGLPHPDSDDLTQWLFAGHPRGSTEPLQVAVARLVGYKWPRQTGSSFLDCPSLTVDGLEKHADQDGVVCINPIHGELPAADRLRGLLADAYGADWTPARQRELLSQVGYESIEDWLRDGFFEQHCALFHFRPFVWHIWDGLRNGFHALVNYHKLAAPNGEGRRTLEKVTYAYLGDWIDRQRADQKNGVEGADARVAAATHLQSELKKILAGEPPYDIFVRWKPLHEQAIGWEPDVNDGVRINIRPFLTARVLNGRGKSSCILRVTPKIKWDKDRGKEPHRAKDDFPWFWSWDESAVDFIGDKEFDGNRYNDLHYTPKFKEAARERHAADEKGHKG